MIEERHDIVCLWDIRVLPNQRGRGIGRQLFRAVEEWAKERRCTLLKIETQDINVPACKFYEKVLRIHRIIYLVNAQAIDHYHRRCMVVHAVFTRNNHIGLY